MNVILPILTLTILTFLFALFFISLFVKKYKLTIFAIGAAALLFVTYFAILLSYSYASRTTYLPQNFPKKFCGFYFGCHLQASVSGVRTAKEIGGVKAQGIFYIVKIKISNDSENKPLSMSAPEATMIDEGPRLYSRIEKAEEQLSSGSKIPFNQTVQPNGSFEKEIVFDLTEPAQELNLSLTDTRGFNKFVELFLVGDEDSLFHEPTLFIIKNNTAS